MLCCCINKFRLYSICFYSCWFSLMILSKAVLCGVTSCCSIRGIKLHENWFYHLLGRAPTAKNNQTVHLLSLWIAIKRVKQWIIMDTAERQKHLVFLWGASASSSITQNIAEYNEAFGFHVLKYSKRVDLSMWWLVSVQVSHHASLVPSLLTSFLPVQSVTGSQTSHWPISSAAGAYVTSTCDTANRWPRRGATSSSQRCPSACSSSWSRRNCCRRSARQRDARRHFDI